MFLQGMWERAVRNYLGPSGTLHSLKNFRMVRFNTPGDTVWVRGQVTRKWRDGARGFFEIELRTHNAAGMTTVGPGSFVCSLPPAAA
jgi:acyl dehydratase